MARLDPTIDLVDVLPRAVRGGMALRIVTALGEIVRVAGDDDATDIKLQLGGLLVTPAPGRAVLQPGRCLPRPSLFKSFRWTTHSAA